MFKTDNGKKAVETLEYLLKYTIHISDLHNSAAMLAQTRNVSVTEFCNKSGYFVFDVIKHLLLLRGMACKVIKHQKKWLFPQECVQNNPSVIGIINTVNLNAYRKNAAGISSLDPSETIDDMINGVVVLKMWTPLQKYYDNGLNFYITTDTSDLRHEYKNGSAWKKNSVSYENLTETVKKELKKHRKSSILMSNNKEVVLLSPKRKGWTSETILNYDCRQTEKIVHQKMAEELADLVVSHIHKNDEGWDKLTHCLYSCLHKMDGELPPDFFTKLALDRFARHETGSAIIEDEDDI